MSVEYKVLQIEKNINKENYTCGMKKISRNEEFHVSCSFQNTFFWRIYIGKFLTRAPGGPNSFNFMPFLEHLQNRMLAPREGLAPPPRGNLGSATDCSPSRMHNSLVYASRIILLESI